MASGNKVQPKDIASVPANKGQEPVATPPGTIREYYKLVSVEQASLPSGEASGGGRWHRYVIEYNGSFITGSRRGSRQEVTRYAKQFAEQLNTRRGSKPGSTWAPRAKRP